MVKVTLSEVASFSKNAIWPNEAVLHSHFNPKGWIFESKFSMCT